VSVVPSALVIPALGHWGDHADHPIGRDGSYEATFGAPYYGVHRVALLQALADGLGGEGLNLGRRCVAVEERRGGAEVMLPSHGQPADQVRRGAPGGRDDDRLPEAVQALADGLALESISWTALEQRVLRDLWVIDEDTGARAGQANGVRCPDRHVRPNSQPERMSGRRDGNRLRARGISFCLRSRSSTLGTQCRN
jgi:hypothetical protein